MHHTAGWGSRQRAAGSSPDPPGLACAVYVLPALRPAVESRTVATPSPSIAVHESARLELDNAEDQQEQHRQADREHQGTEATEAVGEEQKHRGDANDLAGSGRLSAPTPGLGRDGFDPLLVLRSTSRIDRLLGDPSL